ncbi:uncharacterized protein LOC131958235 isoform X2 [Physella acuta]|uniref:uncharacterized protein LOC131958235 isoform X2 n=1 Tax=Physella acuta TaxID=109671 RepID=UPI0027DADB93|nr:uncharacterized protein LOC131958235 isoform X2 [Physella acuta]
MCGYNSQFGSSNLIFLAILLIVFDQVTAHESVAKEPLVGTPSSSLFTATTIAAGSNLKASPLSTNTVEPNECAQYTANGSNTTVTVMCDDYCFTAWSVDDKNRSNVVISMQGCWRMSEESKCRLNVCVAENQPRLNTLFCCCTGHLCNANVQSAYVPSVPAHSVDIVPGPHHDQSYKKKTIIISLVSVVSVTVVVVFSYLLYRLYITPKPVSPPPSTVVKVDTDSKPGGPQLSLDDLKIEEVLVRGKYSDVRKGWLGNKEVAVKIYQPHHRQYYFNERNAFTQPFMEHPNIVKFFGAREQEDPGTHMTQFVIVTEYMTLGSLTSYLKHNTIDWYTLCHMCLGIAKGLAYLHTDIQKGGLFKPAMAHRDLNTRNILVGPDLTCVVADLGFAVGMMGSKIIKNGVAENAEQASLADVGTLRYMAPEVFDGAVNLRDCEASLKQIDVYALGLVMWEVASRCVDLYQGAPVPEYQLPYQAEKGPHPTFEDMQILVVKYKTRPKLPEVWKDSNPAVRCLKETIEDCWDSDAEARLTALCVQERVSDISSLWFHGTKHRGVTPTLNATMNITENSNIHNCATVVSNGSSYIPSYVDRNNEANIQGVDIEKTSPVILNSLRRKADEDSDTDVVCPLMGSSQVLGEGSSMDLKDQSMSESTVDTILPTTPSTDTTDRANQTPLKANNIMLAKNKAVILHPNQGRNPTAQRNTHKRSDEELTVSGNRLVGPEEQNQGGNTSSCTRRVSTQSAPPNPSTGGSFDGYDAVESSSLVQNDALSHQHSHPRNMPIPYLQNHVHGEGVASAAPNLTRPKLANISNNRNSYLRLQGEDGSPQADPSQRVAEKEIHSKSLKHKLSKLIRPMDLGNKFTKLMFGKHKKSQVAESGTSAPGQYINSGLEASPIGRNPQNSNLNQPVILAVEMINGSPVSKACSDPEGQTAVTSGLAQSRLSATNVMRLGLLGNTCHEELPSPSLFPKPGHTASNDQCYFSSELEQDKALPLQNLSAGRSAKDYGSIRPPGQLVSSDQAETVCVERSVKQGSSSVSSFGQSSSHNSNSSSNSSVDIKELAPNLSLSKIAFAPLDDSEMNGGVQSPQNKTIAPINKSVAAHGKKNVHEPAGAAAGSNPAFENYHQDTKGGNSVMLNIHIREKSLSKDSSRGSRHLSSQQGKPSRGEGSNSGTRKLPQPAKLSQSQSVTDLGRQSDGSHNAGQSKSVTDLGWPAAACNTAGQDQFWQESDKSFNKHRPKSLSLKGHNYGRSRPVHSTPHRPKLDENGTLPIVVPNITLDKSSPMFQPTARPGHVVAPSVAVSSYRSSTVNSASTNSCQGNKVSTQCMPNDSGESAMAKGAGLKDRSESSEKIRRRIKTPVSFKKGRLSLYDDRLMTQSLCPVENCGDHMSSGQMGCSDGEIKGHDYQKMIKSDSDLVL